MKPLRTPKATPEIVDETETTDQNEKPYPDDAQKPKKIMGFAPKELGVFGVIIIIIIALCYVFLFQDDTPSPTKRVAANQTAQWKPAYQHQNTPQPQRNVQQDTFDSSQSDFPVSQDDLYSFKTKLLPVLAAEQKAVKNNTQVITELQSQLSDLEKQVAETKSELATLNLNVVKLTNIKQPKKSPYLVGYKIKSIQSDMVWVVHQNTVYALSVGDSIDGFTVNAIDSQKHHVLTTKGIIR